MVISRPLELQLLGIAASFILAISLVMDFNIWFGPEGLLLLFEERGST